MVEETMPAMLGRRREGSWNTSTPTTYEEILGEKEDVEETHHQVLHGNLATPELAAQFAIDLKSHLLHHGVDLLLVADRLEVDHLTRHWLLH